MALLILAGLPLSAQVQTAPQPAAPAVAGAGNYIITFQPGISKADRAASVRRAGATLRFNYDIVVAVAVTVPNTNVFAALQRDPAILEIIPDQPVRAFQSPKAPPWSGGGGTTGEVTPEGVKRVGVPTATSNGEGVGIAILDTGLDFAHRDLNEGSAWFDVFGGNCGDGHGHATHVAGIAAALDNDFDVIGVAPLARPYCVKVLDNQGNGTDGTVIAGLDWVAQKAGLTGTAPNCEVTNPPSVTPPIRVVNMSLGREGTLDDNPELRKAVQCLYNNGIVVAVAAGNDQTLEVSENVPATYPEVLAIASTTAADGSNACRFFSGSIKKDTASWFTTDGAFDPLTKIGVTISAPGEDKENIDKACFIRYVGILSLKAGGGTTRMAGTSMSAPHVSGIVARIAQRLLNAGTFTADGGQVENIRSEIRSSCPTEGPLSGDACANRKGVAPLNSPVSSYSFDDEREGVGIIGTP